MDEDKPINFIASITEKDKAAVEYIRKYFLSHVLGRIESSDARLIEKYLWKDHARLDMTGFPEVCNKPNTPQELALRLWEYDKISSIKKMRPLQRLVEFAGNGDPIAYEAAVELAADFLREGKELKEPLTFFAADVLSGVISKPRNRPHKANNRPRNIWIISAIEYLVEVCGYKLSRNDSTEIPSACDITAEAASKLEPHITYDTVRKIYNKRKDADFDVLNIS